MEDLIAKADVLLEALPYLRRFVAEAPKNRYGADLPRVRALLARLENQS